MAFILRKKISGGAVQTTDIPAQKLRIGRGTGNELQFDDLLIGLKHAEIEQTDNGYILTDLGSATGTYVNGQRTEHARLSGGDKILIGPLWLTFHPVEGMGNLAVIELEETISAGVPASAPADEASPFSTVDYVGSYALSNRWVSQSRFAVLGAFAVLIMLGGSLAFGRINMTPGPLTTGHVMFANNCASCHATWNRVANETCLNCHDPGQHQDAKLSTTECRACHSVHHSGIAKDRELNHTCVQCHADLAAVSSKSSVNPSISDFTRDHPEFSVNLSPAPDAPRKVRLDASEGLEDGTRLKLNHKVHLDPDLPGTEETGPLACSYCHIPAADGTGMRPVRFDPACIECHREGLAFDSDRPEEFAPHGKQSKELDAFLRTVYKGDGEHVERALNKLLGKTRRKNTQGQCLQCHDFDLSGIDPENEAERLPPLAKVSRPARWFSSALFSHKAHGLVKCESCHDGAPASELTSDVMIPKIDACRRCHNPSDGARTECRACHLYHDHPGGVIVKGRYTIDDLVAGRTPPGHVASTERAAPSDEGPAEPSPTEAESQPAADEPESAEAEPAPAAGKTPSLASRLSGSVGSMMSRMAKAVSFKRSPRPASSPAESGGSGEEPAVQESTEEAARPEQEAAVPEQAAPEAPSDLPAGWTEGDGIAPFGGDISFEEAKSRAKDMARRDAIEKAAGSNVKGSSVVYNYQLVEDLVSSVTRGVIEEEVVLLEKTEEMRKDGRVTGLVFHTKIRAKVRLNKAGHGDNFTVQASLNKSSFQEGEEALISVRPSADGYVYIFSVSQDEQVWVLFPNSMMPQDFVKGGREFVFPPDTMRDLGIRLRVSAPPGLRRATEKIKIIVAKKKLNVSGMGIKQGVFSQSSGKDTAMMTDLLKQLASLDGDEWAEATLPYEVRK
ncbi:MAG: DUF4384 domain-containing protein [Nitrospirota bacterium]